MSNRPFHRAKLTHEPGMKVTLGLEKYQLQTPIRGSYTWPMRAIWHWGHWSNNTTGAAAECIWYVFGSRQRTRKDKYYVNSGSRRQQQSAFYFALVVPWIAATRRSWMWVRSIEVTASFLVSLIHTRSLSFRANGRHETKGFECGLKIYLAWRADHTRAFPATDLIRLYKRFAGTLALRHCFFCACQSLSCDQTINLWWCSIKSPCHDKR